MSLQAVRPYITSRLESLGYTEHIDPFNDENIPANLLDNGFHQLMLQINGADKNQAAQGLDVPVQVKCFFKGFRDPNEALTQSIINAEAIIADVTLLNNYSSYSPPITSVLLDSVSFEPYSNESNDNIVQAVFVFRFVVYICVE
ncbi:MAG: hypothetical protein IPQ08_05870 [Chitinophagaceae bacterium]|nr:hypothetical protein [Chitinophagaceae bacterium]